MREAYKQVSLDNQGDVNKGPTFAELKDHKKRKMDARMEKQREKELKNKEALNK